MPGIVGIFGKGARQENRNLLHAMVDCMMYEEFYRSGTFVDEAAGIWLGWVCKQGSFSDCMPIWNERRDICVIFVGEDFGNDGHGPGFRSDGQRIGNDDRSARYLVSLYEKMGSRFLETLNGPFNGVVIDLRIRDAILFNDRFGQIRLYYHEDQSGLYFASEAKALAQSDSEHTRL